MTISNFSGHHFFLSNFYPTMIGLSHLSPHGDVHYWYYPSVEHAFQSLKSEDRAFRTAVQLAHTPAEAKRLGRKATLRPDWEQRKDEFMHTLLDLKFGGNGYMSHWLLETGDEQLIEGNVWGDRYWGAVRVNGDWSGENKLGQLLMKIRAEKQEIAQ